MNLYVFNVCVLLGWLLTSIGACLWSVHWGMMIAGLLLLVLTLFLARLAGLRAPGAPS